MHQNIFELDRKQLDVHPDPTNVSSKAVWFSLIIEMFKKYNQTAFTIRHGNKKENLKNLPGNS